MTEIIQLMWKDEQQKAGRRHINRVVHDQHFTGTTSKMWNGTPIKQLRGYINFYGQTRAVGCWADFDDIPVVGWDTDCPQVGRVE